MAVASLIVGLVGLCTAGVASIVGLILGIVALRKINASQGAIGGRGLAIAGIACSAAVLVFQLLLAAIMAPVMMKAREKARQSTCLSNVKQLETGLLMYCQDYDEMMTPAATWAEGINPYVRNLQIFQCPNGPGEMVPGMASYGYNRNQDMEKLWRFQYPAETASLFETNPGPNVSGGPESVVFRHSNGANFGYADGHAKWLSESNTGNLRWDISGGSAPSFGGMGWK